MRDDRSKQEFQHWLAQIHDANRDVRGRLGTAKLLALECAGHLLAAPRTLSWLVGGGKRQARHELQLPWLPLWPGLSAKPVHDAAEHPWTSLVRDAHREILAELAAVQRSFERARFDSDLNPKRWETYYFYLQGKPVREHLAACPTTAALLARLPHNSFHVCFSAIAPSGALHPHTGPTNTSLTAHLGLAGCSGSTLTVADREVRYREGEVLVFDDTFVHWVDNGGSETRYTLMITFWHPELGALERAAIGRIFRNAEI